MVDRPIAEIIKELRTAAEENPIEECVVCHGSGRHIKSEDSICYNCGGRGNKSGTKILNAQSVLAVLDELEEAVRILRIPNRINPGAPKEAVAWKLLRDLFVERYPL